MPAVNTRARRYDELAETQVTPPALSRWPPDANPASSPFNLKTVVSGGVQKYFLSLRRRQFLGV